MLKNTNIFSNIYVVNFLPVTIPEAGVLTPLCELTAVLKKKNTYLGLKKCIIYVINAE